MNTEHHFFDGISDGIIERSTSQTHYPSGVQGAGNNRVGVTGTIGIYRLLSENQSSIAVAELMIGAEFLLVTVLMRLSTSIIFDTVRRKF